eukprot:TRINITY_DN107251_c0_g1_i1.p1 TRINITY_DN107251_c0_g1~~TRINITY_DN107251_c0_g1_i1.p1  ORF type:complete len:280 (+),score=54.30 TRINITY_DN107251_c0_g1_i1:100-840(+)
MYPDHFVEDEAEGKVVFLVLTEGAVLTVSLPVHYPLEKAQLSLSCPAGSAAVVAEAVQELEAIVGEGKDAEMECCAQLVERFLQLAEVLTPEDTEEGTGDVEADVGGAAAEVPAPVHDGDGPMIPQHIKALVTNVHNNRCKVYVGRPDANPKGRGKPTSGHPRWGWGNPFSMGGGASRGSVIRQYTNWILAPERSDLRDEARRELQGKTLGCFCSPLSCHGHVLALIANTKSDEELRSYFPEGSGN